MMSHSVPTASPELQAAIWDLEYSERCSLLMLSLIDKNKHNPVAPVLDIIKFVNVMAQYLNINERVIVANSFRDFADLLEREKQVVVS